MHNNIIGVDPGFGITGYGIIQLKSEQTGNLELMEAGLIRSDKKKSLGQRLLEIYQKITEILKEFSPESMAIEDTYSTGAFPKSAIYIGHVQGIALLAAAEQRIEVFHYYPLQVKKSLLGNGHATKSQVQKMVQTTLNLREIPKPDDVADAIAVALCHAHRRKIDRAS